jgi:hypothetical protein
MGSASEWQEPYEYIDTDIDDEEDAEDSNWKSAFVKEGLFAKLRPLNRPAMEAFHKLVTSEETSSEHHRQFILVDPGTDKTSLRTGCFILSLGMLPEFPPLGWRIGSGREKHPNLGVDLLIYEGSEVVGLHARLSWVKDGGGLFIIADNLRAKVLLNGEAFSNERRLIPFGNMIGIGECFFTLEFPTRLPEEEEQFRVELSAFYSRVYQDAAPLILPTPSDNEERVGDWTVRNAVAVGGSGRVSIVTHVRTGKSAAMKEIWGTPRNSRAIDREVSIAKTLKGIKHVRRYTKSCLCTLLII